MQSNIDVYNFIAHVWAINRGAWKWNAISKIMTLYFIMGGNE
jgi:hypothetical protein